MASAGTVTLELDAKSVRLVRELQKAQRQTSRAARGMQRSMTRAFRNIRRAATAVGTAFAGLQLLRLGKDSINLADQFNKLNDRLGISVEAISELSFVADQGGVSFQTLALGLQRMQRRIAEAAKGSGEAQKALRDLGLDAEKLTKLPLETQFEIIAERLSLVETASERTALGVKLLDSEGLALLQTMTDGAKGIRNLREEAQLLGRSLSKDQVQAASDAKDAMNRFETAVSSLSDEIVLRGVPALTEFVEKANNIFFFKPSEERKLQDQLDALRSQIQFFESIGDLSGAEQLRQQFFDIAESLEALRRETKASDEATLAFVNTLESVTLGFDDNIKQARQSLEDFNAQYDQWIQRARDNEGIVEIDIEPFLERAEESAERVNEMFGKAFAEARENERFVERLGLTFSSAFEDAIVEGGKLRDVMQGLLQDIIRIAVRLAITEPLGRFLGGFFSPIFGGAKAEGGPVAAGVAYKVGEQGEELFIPGANGMILPNDVTRSLTTAAPINIYNTVQATGADSVVRLALPSLLEQSRQLTISEIQKLQQQGRL